MTTNRINLGWTRQPATPGYGYAALGSALASLSEAFRRWYEDRNERNAEQQLLTMSEAQLDDIGADHGWREGARQRRELRALQERLERQHVWR